jgi:hypothetical protein
MYTTALPMTFSKSLSIQTKKPMSAGPGLPVRRWTRRSPLALFRLPLPIAHLNRPRFRKETFAPTRRKRSHPSNALS